MPSSRPCTKTIVRIVKELTRAPSTLGQARASLNRQPPNQRIRRQSIGARDRGSCLCWRSTATNPGVSISSKGKAILLNWSLFPRYRCTFTAPSSFNIQPIIGLNAPFARSVIPNYAATIQRASASSIARCCTSCTAGFLPIISSHRHPGCHLARGTPWM